MITSYSSVWILLFVLEQKVLFLLKLVQLWQFELSTFSVKRIAITTFKFILFFFPFSVTSEQKRLSNVLSAWSFEKRSLHNDELT